MAQYIQYDESGFITATVITNEAPDFPRQLVFDEPVDVSGKMVDIATLTLVDQPPEE